MASKTASYLVVAAGAFLGGLALGLLVSPQTGRENRALIRKKSSDVADYVSKKSRKVRSDVSKEVRNNFPDLYDATSDIGLNDTDVLTTRG
jgi:gas vesicle protein